MPRRNHSRFRSRATGTEGHGNSRRDDTGRNANQARNSYSGSGPQAGHDHASYRQRSWRSSRRTRSRSRSPFRNRPNSFSRERPSDANHGDGSSGRVRSPGQGYLNNARAVRGPPPPRAWQQQAQGYYGQPVQISISIQLPPQYEPVCSCAPYRCDGSCSSPDGRYMPQDHSQRWSRSRPRQRTQPRREPYRDRSRSPRPREASISSRPQRRSGASTNPRTAPSQSTRLQDSIADSGRPPSVPRCTITIGDQAVGDPVVASQPSQAGSIRPSRQPSIGGARELCVANSSSGGGARFNLFSFANLGNSDAASRATTDPELKT